MTLPNKILFIIGAPKCGTTALYKMLSGHPQLSWSEPKEPDYFSRHYDKGVSYYLARFAELRDEYLLSEASPGYLSSVEAPARIKADVPDSRFIVLLRDPVERALSQYYYGVQRGTDPCSSSFEKFLAVDTPWRDRVLELGCYGNQLSHWYSFFESERFLVLPQGFLTENQQEAIDRICRFAGIESFQTETLVANEGRYLRGDRLFSVIYRFRGISKSFPVLQGVASGVRRIFETKQKPRIPSHVVSELRDFYAEDDKLLRSLPGVSLPEWSSERSGG